MNNKQRKILEFLSTCPPSEYITQEKISEETGITETDVGSECYKLREIKFLEHGDSQLGEKLKFRITAFGQIQIENEDERKSNSTLLKRTTIATIGLLIVTGILAGGTIILTIDSQSQTKVLQEQTKLFSEQSETLQEQTELFQKDFDYTNRPWIGVDKLDVREDGIAMVFKNYGRIPNDPGIIYSKLTNFEFTQKDVQTKSNEEILHVTMPGHILDITVRAEEYDLMMKYGKNGTWSIFLGAELEYPYGEDKKGHFGFMGKFNNQTGKIDIFKTWQS